MGDGSYEGRGGDSGIEREGIGDGGDPVEGPDGCGGWDDQPEMLMVREGGREGKYRSRGLPIRSATVGLSLPSIHFFPPARKTVSTVWKRRRIDARAWSSQQPN